MLFRNIILTALITAVIAGLTLGVLQSLSTVPVIYSAEQYEVAEDQPVAANPHSHEASEHAHQAASAHSHGDGDEKAEWAPKDGVERVSYTFVADILIAFGHGLLLLSFMALLYLKFGKPEISWKSGLLMGLGGYLSFYVATVLGLPPEVPGTIAANLHDRQIWWTLTIIASIAGLSTLYLAPGAFKLIGLVFIVLPHLIGAPQPQTPGFINQNPQAIQALEHLEHNFLLSTAWVNLVYWLVLGFFSGLIANKRFHMESPQTAFSQG
jgi:cobalt transporter subunit CbtA